MKERNKPENKLEPNHRYEKCVLGSSTQVTKENLAFIGGLNLEEPHKEVVVVQ